jgi:hypothetical protein
MSEPYAWSRLNHLQVGRYAEYFVKMEFTLLGFDVYTSEVDDKGIDLVIRQDLDRYYGIQVKAVRSPASTYVFMRKSVFALRETLLLAVVLLEEKKVPRLYLIPSTAWLEPNALLVSHDYIGKKSEPEWGVNLSSRNLPFLEDYEFEKIASGL